MELRLSLIGMEKFINQLDKEKELILDTTEEGVNAADLYYATKKNSF